MTEKLLQTIKKNKINKHGKKCSKMVTKTSNSSCLG